MGSGSTKIGTIILWSNGMVMCFDSDGAQFPEYQGTHKDVKKRLIEDNVDLNSTTFFFGLGDGEDIIRPISNSSLVSIPQDLFFYDWWPLIVDTDEDPNPSLMDIASTMLELTRDFLHKKVNPKWDPDQK